MRRSPQIAGLGILAILIPLAITQDNGNWNQNASGSLAAAKNIRVKLDMGSVVLHGSSQSNITYSMHRHSDSDGRHGAEMRVNAFVKGDTAWIEGEWQGGHVRSGELVVNVPRDTAWLRIETGGGSVEATSVAGHVEIESGGGKIYLNDIGGSVAAETGGDSIEIGSIGGDLKAETGGGNVSIGSIKGMVRAETGGGNISVQSCEQGAVVQAGGGNVDIRRCAGKVKASTGGGSITLGDIGGPAEISTGGGSIHLSSAKGRVGASTGAGSIELFGVPSAKVETGAGGITVKLIAGGDRSDSVLETSAGDITVYIAPNVALSVRASIDLGNGHRISSDFPDIHISGEGSQWESRTLTAEGKLNGGGPLLKVRTTTGNICFRRGN